MTQNIAALSPKEFILIKGAKLHNLNNVDVAIPRNKLVVITGLSGSGKSSLAFDTLFAEGQRRYVESLSSYARQFLGKLNKPQVDYIKGISPAIAIEQKVNSTNPRSTVGTTTEIYDYLKLLFARIGKTYSPISGNEVVKHQVSEVINYVKTFEIDDKLLLLAPIKIAENKNFETTLNILLQQGYARIKILNDLVKIESVLADLKNFSKIKAFYLVIDRVVIEHNEDFYNRLADAIQTAFYEGHGNCVISSLKDDKQQAFSNNFQLDGLNFLEPNLHLFSFNNPYGACTKCEGYGTIIGIDEDLVIPNSTLSIYDNAIFPWKTEAFLSYKEPLIMHASKFDIPIHKPWFQLSQKQKELVWNGNSSFEGIHTFFKHIEEQSYKIQNRVLLSRYRGKTVCDVCHGKRLKPEASYVKINGTSITDLIDLPLDKLSKFFKSLVLTTSEKEISKRILLEINNRIEFLQDVGLSYLSLNRNSRTLSGGESQRINLATSLGSSLVGSMYILDEPSIGLHPKDTQNLIKVLKNLRDLGNTVIVVEHDEDVMKASDYIIDMGPEAGSFGGDVVAEGTYAQLLKSDSLTGKYLSHKLKIPLPIHRKNTRDFIQIEGARAHNLKNIDVKIPLNCLVVITGVSGSGKSTLVKHILYPALQKHLTGYNNEKIGQFNGLKGSFEQLKTVEFIDQNPIGRSSRSNPVTYIKAYDDIRNLFASEKLSQIRNFKSKHFSFNVDGGRCDTCKGEGEVTIEMQFMADVHLLCESCNGKRFKKEVLEVTFENKSIADILELSVDNAITFFNKTKQPKIVQKLKALQDVGLGYVQLGQSSSTLSGGEAQRIKLASFLVKGATKERALFIFDEPTTGLHFHDILKLVNSLQALIDKGHSVVVIEHNLDLVKCADYIIDLGKEGGVKGGEVCYQGTPEGLLDCKDSYTAYYLKEKFDR